MEKSTMEDVARLAGVNKATVSRALRGDSRISQGTRERVWKIAKELGYRLDLAASGLSGGKTGIAALVLEEIDPWLTGGFFDGLNRVLSRTGRDLLLKLPGFQPGELFPALRARHVDCILWAGGEKSRISRGEIEPAIPVVTLGFSFPGIPAVLLSPERTIERLETVAGDSGILRYFQGSGPLLFPFLSGLLKPWNREEKCVFPVFDGVDRCGVAEGAGFYCTRCRIAPPTGMYSLLWPSFEFGITAARILSNLLQGHQSVPETTFLVPSMESPEGELLPYVK